jgi:hypothetical protein
MTSIPGITKPTIKGNRSHFVCRRLDFTSRTNWFRSVTAFTSRTALRLRWSPAAPGTAGHLCWTRITQCETTKDHHEAQAIGTLFCVPAVLMMPRHRRARWAMEHILPTYFEDTEVPVITTLGCIDLFTTSPIALIDLIHRESRRSTS